MQSTKNHTSFSIYPGIDERNVCDINLPTTAVLDSREFCKNELLVLNAHPTIPYSIRWPLTRIRTSGRTIAQRDQTDCSSTDERGELPLFNLYAADSTGIVTLCRYGEHVYSFFGRILNNKVRLNCQTQSRSFLAIDIYFCEGGRKFNRYAFFR